MHRVRGAFWLMTALGCAGCGDKDDDSGGAATDGADGTAECGTTYAFIYGTISGSDDPTLVARDGDGAEIAGQNEFCENAALIYPGRAYTVQAHPEFKDDFVEGLIETRAKGVVPDALLDTARSRMGGKRDSDRIADRIEAFFRAAVSDRQGAAVLEDR